MTWFEKKLSRMEPNRKSRWLSPYSHLVSLGRIQPIECGDDDDGCRLQKFFVQVLGVIYRIIIVVSMWGAARLRLLSLAPIGDAA